MAYADNAVMIVENEEEMRSIIERLEKYVEANKLELNIHKTKIMRFRNGGGRMVKRDWKGDRRSEGVSISGVHIAEEWRARDAC